MKSLLLYRKIIILMLFFFIAAPSNSFSSIKLDKIAFFTPSPPHRVGLHYTLKVKDKNAYLAFQTVNDFTWGSEGSVTKFDSTGDVKFYTTFKADSLTRNPGDSVRLVPRALDIDDEGNISVYSEHALYVAEDLFFTSQTLNVKKFSAVGQEFYNFSDTTNLQNTMMAIFPIEIDKNENIISIHTIQNMTEPKTIFKKYNEQGEFLMTTNIDSNIRTYDPDTEKWASRELFRVQGFTQGVDDIYYCYGEREMKIKLGDYVSDTLSSYVMGIDTNGILMWKHIFYTGIVTNCYPLKDGGVIVVGLDINTYAAKFNSEGELIWRKFFGENGFRKWPYKIIETSSDDFFVVGRSQSKGQSDYDNYIAKLDKDGLLLWEDKFGLPFDERFQEIIEFAPNKYYIVEVFPGYVGVHKFEDDLSDVAEERENNLDYELTVSPNPVEDFLSINTNLEFGPVEIFSILGFKVLETDLKERINICHLPAGMYFIKVGSTYDKFIKQK